MKKIGSIALLFVLLIGLAACGSNEDPEIQIYTRDTTSGTREAFFKGIDFSDAVEDNSQLAKGYVEVGGNGDMISAVENDEFGIGYISLSSLADSDLIGLDFEGIKATEANVLNDTYGLKRPFMYMTRDAANDSESNDAANAIVKAFVAYMGTQEGKAIIKSQGGIVSISASDPSWDDIKDDYSIVSQDNSSVTVKFGGSTSVEKVAKALSSAFSSLAGNFVAEHNHTGSGDAFKRVQGEEKGSANMLHIGFASRNFKDSEAGATDTYGQLAWDAVVAVVNQKNTKLTNITSQQLAAIYGGDTKLWSELAK